MLVVNSLNQRRELDAFLTFLGCFSDTVVLLHELNFSVS